MCGSGYSLMGTHLCHSDNGPGDFVQDHCKRRTASLLKACYRSLEHFVLRNKIPGNLITGFQSQFSNEFTLRPSVSLAEGMQSVDLTEIVSGAFAEYFRAISTQAPLAGEPVK